MAYLTTRGRTTELAFHSPDLYAMISTTRSATPGIHSLVLDCGFLHADRLHAHHELLK